MIYFDKILIATGNKGKYAEFARMIPSTLAGEVIFAPELAKMEVDETGTSFLENAVIKSRAWADASGLPSLADDSGIEVAALGGAPGIHSARIVDGSDADRNNWLLSKMLNVSDRRARFVAALSISLPKGHAMCDTPPFVSGDLTVAGECCGTLDTAPSGDGGFGYDPLFIPDGFDISFAALPADVKNNISHRAAAMQALLKALGAC